MTTQTKVKEITWLVGPHIETRSEEKSITYGELASGYFLRGERIPDEIANKPEDEVAQVWRYDSREILTGELLSSEQLMIGDHMEVDDKQFHIQSLTMLAPKHFDLPGFYYSLEAIHFPIIQ